MPRFEYVRGTSSKFWEVRRDGRDVHVTFGRIGSAGRSSSKTHRTAEVAQASVDKSIKEKIKKGYSRAESSWDDPSLDGLEHEGLYSDRFLFREVVDFDDELGPEHRTDAVNFRVHLGPEHAWGSAANIDDVVAKVDKLSQTRDAAHLRGLVVGRWSTDGNMPTSRAIIDAIVEGASSFKSLRAVFLGDIGAEQAEISWINQGDFAPLLSAFEGLEHLRVRGPGSGYNNGEPVGELRSTSLRSLTLQTGGLPGQVIDQVCSAHLPALEHLELWIGTEMYGGITDVERLAPIFSGKLFPKLRYLGLRNAMITDAIATRLATSPVLERIEALDLSMGNLTDEGAELLLSNPATAKLRKLDLKYNFLSPSTRRRFNFLKIPFFNGDAGNAWEEEYDGQTLRYCEVME